MGDGLDGILRVLSGHADRPFLNSQARDVFVSPYLQHFIEEIGRSLQFG